MMIFTSFSTTKITFDFSPSILNREIRTSIEHPHDIAGYLQHPEVIHVHPKFAHKLTQNNVFFHILTRLF